MNWYIDTQKINGMKGITLITLVVTIVILLIITGVTLYFTIGDNGMIMNAKETREQAIVTEEKSSVERAVIYLQMLDESSLTAQNLETEIEKNYGQDSVTVEGDYTFIVTFKESGNKYFVDQNGTVIEINNVKFDLLYSVSIEDDSADITLVPIYNGTETGGTVEIKCPDDTILNVAVGEEAIYTVTEEGIYHFEATYAGDTVTKDIEVRKVQIPEGGESTSEELNILESDIEIIKIPSSITNQDVQVTINVSGTEYTLQYSLDKEEWSKYQEPITMKNNGQIYVRLSNNSGKVGNYIAINITNIDKLPPNKFTPATINTTNSITLSGSTTDADATSTNASSGIEAYYFSIDDGAN